MTPTAQASLILLAAVATVGTLTARSRKNLPTLSLLVRLLFHIARFWWSLANAADWALFTFRDEWIKTREQVYPLNEMWWRGDDVQLDKDD